MTVWDDVYRNRAWGRWPDLDAVRAVARTAQATDRPLDVLEVGCGTGAQLWFLAHEGHRAVGLDLAQVGLAHARRRMDEESLDASLAVADAAALPLGDATFDLVLDVEAFGHNHQDLLPQIWREAARVLRPGGTLVSIGFTAACTGSDTGELVAGRTVRDVQVGPIQRVGIVTWQTIEAATELANHARLEVADATVRRREVLGDDGYVVEELVVRATKPT